MRRPLSALFVAAAGPRAGFGHLVRCGVLARVMGVPAEVALRASTATRRTARSLGWRVHPAQPAILRTLAPALVVVDDPSPTETRRWIRAARAAGAFSVAVRDLGLHDAGADLTIDGSLARAVPGRDADLQGPAYAVLDPAIRARARHSKPRAATRVVIALGGGAHVRSLGVRIASRLHALVPEAEILLAPGFHPAPRPARPPGCRWLDAGEQRDALATAAVAIVAGGMTLYEACALSTPIVAMAVVGAQRVTTAACAAAGAAVDASGPDLQTACESAARSAAALLHNPAVRASLAKAAGRLVDGHGAARIAAELAARLRAGDRSRHVA